MDLAVSFLSSFIRCHKIFFQPYSKRDIAQPFSLGMPSLKLCQRITKQNPEICTVKYPVKTENLEKKDLSKLRVKQLKQILSERGVDYTGLLEKEEFIAKVQETEHLAGADEF
jgi:hypothetical protein